MSGPTEHCMSALVDVAVVVVVVVAVVVVVVLNLAADDFAKLVGWAMAGHSDHF